MATASDAIHRTGAYRDAMLEGLGSSFLTHESRGLSSESSTLKKQMLPRLAKIKTALSYVNESQDMWVRLAHRNRLISQGMDSWEATAVARDRLDYFQGGQVIKAFDTFTPYLNVGVQSVAKAATAAAKDKVGALAKYSQVVGITAGVTLANMISSPETNKAISTDDKVRNWNITFGDQRFIIDPEGNKRYMYVPLRLDAVVAPVVVGVVGGLELAEYGKAPDDIVLKAANQFSPLPGGSSVPMISAVNTYAANYDFYRDSPIYRGPKVKPEDEFRAGTSSVFKEMGAATGMSPMRLEAAAGKLVNANNFYIQAMGGAYRLMFEGADPRQQAMSTEQLLINSPGLSRVVKLTNPMSGMLRQLEEAEKVEGSKNKRQKDGLDDLIFRFEHKQGVTQEQLQTYINNQPAESRAKLIEHAKVTINVNKVMSHFSASDKIPAKSWWIATAKVSPNLRAQEFYNKWVSADQEDRQRMLGVASSLQRAGVGYMNPEFQRAFAAERKLLGDDHR